MGGIPSAISLAGKLVESVCEGVSWAAYHPPFLLQITNLRVGEGRGIFRVAVPSANPAFA